MFTVCSHCWGGGSRSPRGPTCPELGGRDPDEAQHGPHFSPGRVFRPSALTLGNRTHPGDMGRPGAEEPQSRDPRGGFQQGGEGTASNTPGVPHPRRRPRRRTVGTGDGSPSFRHLSFLSQKVASTLLRTGICTRVHTRTHSPHSCAQKHIHAHGSQDTCVHVRRHVCSQVELRLSTAPGVGRWLTQRTGALLRAGGVGSPPPREWDAGPGVSTRKGTPSGCSPRPRRQGVSRSEAWGQGSAPGPWAQRAPHCRVQGCLGPLVSLPRLASGGGGGSRLMGGQWGAPAQQGVVVTTQSHGPVVATGAPTRGQVRAGPAPG